MRNRGVICCRFPRDDSYRADTKISAGHRWYPVMTPLLLAGRRLRYMHRLLSVCTGYKECGERTGGCLIPSLVRVAVVFLTLIRCVVVIVGYKYTRIALRLQPELPSWQKTREKERKKEKERHDVRVEAQTTKPEVRSLRAQNHNSPLNLTIPLTRNTHFPIIAD